MCVIALIVCIYMHVTEQQIEIEKLCAKLGIMARMIEPQKCESIDVKPYCC